ncbi:ester cyclase [Streptomyces sp. MUM 203J]|uniref:ester cyclase n=1 Tax=Streptomyces sp. MUM 203J TaxID=2791990 RepID=UPI001F04F8EA|nr:ester cyclase [Streptomyces sp. MUM 203J]MCH0543346.1 ester cyclase [Streptomyces sp. MUM 203J]
MTFVQVIDCRTQRADELNKLMDTWVAATKGKRTATHSIVAKDRSDASHVVEIVEFPSYEEAMKNSHLPETDRIYRELVALCEGEPSFTDLDVVRDEQLNKALAREFCETLVNRGDMDAAYKMCTADYVEHDPSMSSYDLSASQVKAENQEILTAFQPTLRLESLCAEGDQVCCRFSYSGRHVGAFQGIEATGREISGTGQVTFRCEGGKIAESWWNTDDLGLMRQLGVVEG